VIVKTKGGTLSREAQQAIPQLVASAVDGLRRKMYGGRRRNGAIVFWRGAGLGPGIVRFDRNWPPPPCMPSSRWWAQNMCAPACTSTTT